MAHKMKWIVTMKDGTVHTLCGKDCMELNNAFVSGESFVYVKTLDGMLATIDILMIKHVDRVPMVECGYLKKVKE